MKRRIFSSLFLVAALASVGVMRGDATEVVEIRLRGRFFAAPATVYLTVAVEPHADNRALRIEIDGDQVFRASEVELDGEREKRFHTLYYKNLPSGSYILRAEVASATEVRGMAEEFLTVAGSDLR